MSFSTTELHNSRLADVTTAIAEAVSKLSPPSTILPLCFTANQQRVAALHDRLAAIDAEMEEKRTKRNAAARRLVAVGGKSRLRAVPDNTVSFPTFQKAGTP